jgi:pimeloyl-ACP methyl ester carboxylesterase
MLLSRSWLVTCILLCSTTARAQDASAISPLPQFEKTTCAGTLVQDDKAECGILSAPENRSSDKSRVIHLPVVILHSRAPGAPRDAVLFMTGGPGLSSTSNVPTSRDVIFTEDRDYVVLEQRGAPNANPALVCPEMAAPKRETATGRLKGTDAAKALATAARNCRNRLVTEGADLAAYTTAQTAADIEALRKALGYEQWDLYGISYSTRLMLTVARDYPNSVRSMVLDSVLPLEVNFEEASAANMIRALNVVFDRCAVSPGCAHSYGDVRKKFYDLIQHADHSPLPLPITAEEAGGSLPRIAGSEVAKAVYSALHDLNAIPDLPRIVAEAYRGDYKLLTGLVRKNLGAPGYAWGLRYSVWCSEEFPFEDRNAIAAQVSPAQGLGGLDLGTLPPEVCDAWRVPPAPAKENQPVVSSVPTLIMAGEFDPDTPPAWGQRLVGPLSHAYFIELRGRSHVAGYYRCGQQVAAEFVRHPEKAPALDCVLSARGVEFAAQPKLE